MNMLFVFTVLTLALMMQKEKWEEEKKQRSVKLLVP